MSRSAACFVFGFLKNNFLPLNMDKEEPNFNIWGEIFDSELVLEAAKVEQIYEKQQEKRRFAQLENDDLQQQVAGAEAKSTQKNTKWAIKTIQGNFKTQKLSTFLFHKKIFDCNNEFIEQLKWWNIEYL